MGYEQDVNRTCRDSGAIGANPVALRYVLDKVETDKSVLDYGAGKNIRQAITLREAGFKTVYAWDIGANFDPEKHQINALRFRYDVVMASNVINVQTDFVWLNWVLSTLANLVNDAGMLVVNYPGSPRRLPSLSTMDMHRELLYYFGHVARPGKYANLFVCKLPIRGKGVA